MIRAATADQLANQIAALELQLEAAEIDHSRAGLQDKFRTAVECRRLKYELDEAQAAMQRAQE